MGCLLVVVIVFQVGARLPRQEAHDQDHGLKNYNFIWKYVTKKDWTKMIQIYFYELKKNVLYKTLIQYKFSFNE